MKDELYYIQNQGYSGNAFFWWGLNSNGYTVDINKAQKFTKEKAEGIIKRSEDTAWPCEYIDANEAAHKTIIDCQLLDFSKSIKGNTFNN